MNPNSNFPIEEIKMTEIMKEMEIYLQDIYRRRIRIPQLVRGQFVLQGFEWRDEDQRKRIYRSIKKMGRLREKVVILHCSVLDKIYPPSVSSFIGICTGHTPNHSLFIYDGLVLSDQEVEEICNMGGLKTRENLIVLHHQQVPFLLKSDFRSLSAC